MSFSGDIKNELARCFPDEYHCLLAELASIIRYAGTVSGDSEHGVITVETENVALAKKFLRLIRKAFDITLNLDIRKLPSGRRNLYHVELSSERMFPAEPAQERGKTKPILNSQSKSGEETVETRGNGDRFSRVWRETADWGTPGFKESLLEYPCCRRAFLRGAFLASGSMSDPGKSYHLEIVCRRQEGAEELRGVMETFEIYPKIIGRKNKSVVYLKDSDSIVDILNVMGASNALMRLENVRIIKDMKNSANRQSNCDTANISKIVRTASRQLEDIRLIECRIGLEELPPLLREMAEVRLEHPEESLQELGAYLNPPVGKSGVNHRLKKLGEIAETLREEA
ncbi:MAG: DNA-binding protein WhiA [Clostridiales bacterium]|nr:DNA-binding protein WhiA [Clostridiales bacterium]